MSAVLDRIEDIRDAIHEWVGLATAYRLIDDDQYTQEPDSPHFTFSLMTRLQRIGVKDETHYNTADGKHYMVGHRRLVATIRARGNPMDDPNEEFQRATDMLAQLQWAVDHPTVRAAFTSRKLVLVSTGEIIETSTVEDNALIPRAAFEAIIQFAIREEVTMDTISSVELTGALDTKLDGNYSTTVGPLTIPQEE